jgi:amidase/6-aminohexanoate-cyclic-dimer hydrolase
MSFSDYGRYDATGLAKLVRDGEVSPDDLLEEAIARTEAINPVINAVPVRHDDYARAQLARGLPDGPFRGVPFLLKDLDLLAGTRTTFGSSVYRDFVADHSSTITQRFLGAGLVIFGKSASPEFGLMPTTEPRLHGPTRNPWNTDHSAGGSSGGAAAAVAAGLVPMAHASDGGGSIRIPAAACGLFGLKPSRARTPSGPDRGEGWSGFSVGHVVGISVRDSAAMLDVLQGPEPSSPYVAPTPGGPFAAEVGRAPGRLRVAFTDRSPYGEPIDPEVVEAVRDAARLLEGLGHHVEECAPTLPHDPARVIVAIVAANTAMSVRAAELYAGRAITDQDVERLTLASARRGGKTTAMAYLAAQQQAFEIGRALAGFMTDVDVFLSPTLCTPALRIGEINTMADDLSGVAPVLKRFMPGTSMFNMSGQPAMTVPMAWTRDGLPIGISFAARYGEEATLFRLAGQLEQERPWRGRTAPVHA